MVVQLCGIQLAFKMSGLHPIIYSILRSMYISLKLFCEHGKYENKNYTKLNHEMKGILVNWFMPSLTKSVLFVSLQSCRI